MRSRTLRFGFLFLLACWFVPAVRAQAEQVRFHSNTDWQIQPSLKNDALCLLNVLSGDPFYFRYYQAEYDHFHPLFTAEENAAFAQLKRVIKDQGGSIVSANLTLYFSVVSDETLPEMIHSAHDSAVMEAAMRKTSYWSDEGWNRYQQARPALETALKALQRVGFSGYWSQTAKPKVQARIAELLPDLPKYNIVPAIERHLGFALSSESITVYLLAYSQPHGIRVTGLRFLTHVSYPFNIVLRNAIHESMHAPYDMRDPVLREAIDLLSRDPLIRDAVEHHDSSFGYNTASGLIEEDCVQALEQIVSEEFNVGRNARAYWQQQDGGMHRLAAAIYVKYRQELAQNSMPFSKWFAHAVQSGALRGDVLQNAVKDFFSAKPSGQTK
jgi:hypothetical protein